MQSVYELSDGSGLILTVGQYLTPALRDIDRRGLPADFGSMPDPGQAGAVLGRCEVEKSSRAVLK